MLCLEAGDVWKLCPETLHFTSEDISYIFLYSVAEFIRWIFMAFLMQTCQIDGVFLLLWAAVNLCKQASGARARWILPSRCCCVFPCWVSNCSISFLQIPGIYHSGELDCILHPASQNPYQCYEKADNPPIWDSTWTTVSAEWDVG